MSPGSPWLRQCSKIANDATGASAAADCDGSGGDVGGAVVERLCGRLAVLLVNVKPTAVRGVQSQARLLTAYPPCVHTAL